MAVTRAALVLLLVAGCAGHTGSSMLGTTQTIDPVEQRPERFARWEDAAPAYRFGPGDRLKVQYLLTPEMNEDPLVGPDGFIGMRAAGRVLVAGLTAEQAQDAIAAASKRLLTNPVVTVSTVDASSGTIYVGGSVAHQGAYPVQGRRGVLEAVLQAGGFDEQARADEVVLIRRSPQDQPMLRTVDLRQFISAGKAAGDVPIFAGDIIFVPRNRISEVDLWIDQFVNRFVPFSRGFSYTIQHGTTVP